MKKRVVFFGTPDFAKSHLQQLLLMKNYEIVAVVSQPDRPAGRKMQLQASPVKALALDSGLPVYTPESMKKNPDLLQTLIGLKPDVCIVVAYGQIFPTEYLEVFKNKVVNVHGSLLPRWRGAAPIQRAIMAGDEKTGVSLQVMVPALDAGAIIGEREIIIGKDMTALELHEAMKAPGAALLAEDLWEYLNANKKPLDQDEAHVTFAKKIEKSEALIDWSLGAKQIYNNFRGLSLGPGVKTTLHKKAIKLKKLLLGDEQSEGNKGQVCSIEADHIVVQCGKGSLKVFALQPESKSQMPVSEFLKGYDLSKGDQFGE